MENTETRQLTTSVARVGVGEILERINAVLAHVGKQIADATAQYTIVTGLEALCRQADPDPAVRVRYENILAELLAVLPETFGKADPEAVKRFYGCPFRQIFPKAKAHFADPGLEAVHLRFAQVWKKYSEPREREFAQRCAFILAESIRLHRESGNNIRPLEWSN